MAHHIAWDNEDKTVVLQQYTEEPSKDDLYHLAQKSAQMLHTVEHTVHLIVDERNIDLMLTSADMAYLEKLTPKNQGVVVVIVPDSKLKYKTLIQQIGKRVGPHAFAEAYFAESLEQARGFFRDTFGVRYASGTAT
jgi:hypothetical protein